MKTVQMTLDEELVEAVDRVAAKMHLNRSAFTRNALRTALQCYQQDELARRHRLGYEKAPVAAEEFSVWEDEQAWGDE